MTPTKFTAGGAPSVTADVLRGLAGDPTLDDPKYGAVSNPRMMISIQLFSQLDCE